MNARFYFILSFYNLDDKSLANSSWHCSSCEESGENEVSVGRKSGVLQSTRT